MAMTPTGLENQLKSELNAEFGASVPGFESFLDKFCKAAGKAIVEYIQGNAEVPSSVTVTEVTGVTPGGGTSGPGTGTATGTVV